MGWLLARLRPALTRRAGQAEAFRRAPLERPLRRALGQGEIVGPLREGLHDKRLEACDCGALRQVAGGRQAGRIGAGRQEGGQPGLGDLPVDDRRAQVGLDLGHFPLGAQPVEPGALPLVLARAQHADQTPQLGQVVVEHARAFLREEQIGEGVAQPRFQRQPGSGGP